MPDEAQPTTDTADASAKEADGGGKSFTQAELDAIVRDRLARDRETFAKKFGDPADLAAKAKRYDEMEQAQKSAEERQAEQAARLQADLEAARSENLRLRVATQHGISVDDLDMLGSGDEETLTQRAQRLAELAQAKRELDQLKEAEAARKGVPQTGRPTSTLRPGATPAEVPIVDDPYGYDPAWTTPPVAFP